MSAGQDHLESAGTVQPNVARLVDNAHPAAAQLALDFISRDRGHAVPHAFIGRGRRADRKTQWIDHQTGLAAVARDRGSAPWLRSPIRGIG